MASTGDEVEVNDNTRSVNFGATIEDDEPFAGHVSATQGGEGGAVNRRSSLTKSKKFREARSMRFSELNQVTGAVSLTSCFMYYYADRYIMQYIQIFLPLPTNT